MAACGGMCVLWGKDTEDTKRYHVQVLGGFGCGRCAAIVPRVAAARVGGVPLRVGGLARAGLFRRRQARHRRGPTRRPVGCVPRAVETVNFFFWDEMESVLESHGYRASSLERSIAIIGLETADIYGLGAGLACGLPPRGGRRGRHGAAPRARASAPACGGFTQNFNATSNEKTSNESLRIFREKFSTLLNFHRRRRVGA